MQLPRPGSHHGGPRADLRSPAAPRSLPVGGGSLAFSKESDLGPGAGVGDAMDLPRLLLCEEKRHEGRRGHGHFPLVRPQARHLQLH